MVRTIINLALLVSLLGVHAQEEKSTQWWNPKTKLTPLALEKSVTTVALKVHARILQGIADLPKSNGTREFGTYGYNASVAYVYNALKLTGAYKLEKHSVLQFAYTSTARSLTIGGVAENPFLDLQYSPSTGPSGVTGQLVLIPDTDAAPSPGCTAADWEGVDVQGKIAVVQRGACNFALKSQLGSERGAVAVIIYNQQEADLTGGTLGAPDGALAPTGFLQKPQGDALAARLAAGEALTATVIIQSSTEERYSESVIATSKAGNQTNIVFAGSHLDSVRAGPGINDNGSGSILNLVIALELAKYKLNNAVRFAWWTAEEIGLVGAEEYVASLSDAERAKIALYLNYDMVASPNYVYGVYDGDGSAGSNSPAGPGPAGSDVIEAAYLDYFKLRKVPTVPFSFDGRSDYGAFLPYGIAAGGVSTGADGVKTPEQAAIYGGTAGAIYDPNYHQAADTYSNLNFTAFTVVAKAAAYVLAEFANSTATVEAARAPGAANLRKAPVRSSNDALVATGKSCSHEQILQ